MPTLLISTSESAYQYCRFWPIPYLSDTLGLERGRSHLDGRLVGAYGPLIQSFEAKAGSIIPVRNFRKAWRFISFVNISILPRDGYDSLRSWYPMARFVALGVGQVGRSAVGRGARCVTCGSAEMIGSSSTMSATCCPPGRVFFASNWAGIVEGGQGGRDSMVVRERRYAIMPGMA